MECSRIRAILFESADTEIPKDLREDVEAHLAECRSCAGQLQALIEQSRALRNLPVVEAPADFLYKVRSRVEKPSVLSSLKRTAVSLLAGKFTGKRFFQLAGAAATAALVIVTVQVALRDGGSEKTLRSPALSTLQPAPPKVQSVPSTDQSTRSTAQPAPSTAQSAPPSVKSGPPPVASPPSVEPPPGEALSSVEAPSALSAPQASPAPPASPAAKARRAPSVESQAITLTLRLPGSSGGGKSRGGASGAGRFSASSPGAARMSEQMENSMKADASKQAAAPGAAHGGGHRPEAKKMLRSPGGGPPPVAQEISSEVVRLIKGANGKVLSAGPARNDNQPETLLAEIPAANYPSFLDRLRRLGKVEPKDDKEFSPTPDAKVRVEVSFATGD